MNPLQKNVLNLVTDAIELCVRTFSNEMKFHSTPMRGFNVYKKNLLVCYGKLNYPYNYSIHYDMTDILFFWVIQNLKTCYEIYELLICRNLWFIRNSTDCLLGHYDTPMRFKQVIVDRTPICLYALDVFILHQKTIFDLLLLMFEIFPESKNHDRNFINELVEKSLMNR